MKTKISQHPLRTLFLCFLALASMLCQAQTAVQDPRLKALAPCSAKGEVIGVEVPAAGNAISNMLTVAALKSGADSQ